MGKIKSLLPILLTALVLTFIIVVVFFRDNIPQKVMPDIMDSDYISFTRKRVSLMMQRRVTI